MTTNGNINDAKTTEVLRKIKLLKAKANDPSVTEAESLAYAAKVAELLAMHQLEESQLDMGIEEADPLGHEEYMGNWNASPARRVLAMAVCKLYNVKPLIRTGKGQAWTLIGRKHNIIMAKDMAAYLIKTSSRLANQWVRANPGGSAVDFKRGCFKRLAERLYDLYEQTAKKEQPVFNSGNPGNLPALYINEARLQRAYIDARWQTNTLRPQYIKQGNSAAAGREAGSNISLNQQLGSGSRSSSFMLGHKK